MKEINPWEFNNNLTNENIKEISPYQILSKYVGLLAKAQKGLIEGSVSRLNIDDSEEIKYFLSLTISELNNYSVNLFCISQQSVVKKYPATIELLQQEENNKIIVNNSKEFESKLIELIQNDSTKKLFASIKEEVKTRKHNFYPFPDFLAKTCYDLTINGLNKNALSLLREKYISTTTDSKKVVEIQNFTNEELLQDLNLLKNNKLNYTSLVLLGKPEIIKEYLPQARVTIEYRKFENQIHDDNRDEIQDAIIFLVDKTVEKIKQRTGAHKFLFDLTRSEIKDFEDDVIREALLNALIHRDYQSLADVRIKQYPQKIEFINPGGFPKGVTIENILTISSTPRSYSLTGVLKKIGFIEEAGQGVDRIFLLVLEKGKEKPDYSLSHQTQVWLTIQGEIKDEGFTLFVEEEQKKRKKEEKLDVFDILTLYEINKGKSLTHLTKNRTNKLLKYDLIKRIGKTNTFTLSEKYEEHSKKVSEIEGFAVLDIRSIANLLKNKKIVKMSDFVNLFEKKRGRNEVKYLIEKLLEKNIFIKEGKGKGTIYKLNKNKHKAEDNFTIIKMNLSKQ